MKPTLSNIIFVISISLIPVLLAMIINLSMQQKELMEKQERLNSNALMCIQQVNLLYTSAHELRGRF